MDSYVGNLPYKTSDDDLRALFAAHGEVTSARVVTDRISGQSKGFGFVEMPDREAARKAIDATNGQDFQGRKLRVNESQPRPQHEERREERRGGGGGGYRGGRGGDRGDRGERGRW